MLKRLVQVGDKWYVRRWTLFGYEYLDTSGLYWRSSGYLKWCAFNSEQEARYAVPKVKKI